MHIYHVAPSYDPIFYANGRRHLKIYVTPTTTTRILELEL